MEIEIGDYIRTKTGFIRKVKNIYMLGWAKKDELCIRINGKYKLKDIVKHSKNIIDLIEVGDLVSGCGVVRDYNDNGEEILGIPIYDDSYEDCLIDFIPLNALEIETILTHEQYEQNCFRLED